VKVCNQLGFSDYEQSTAKKHTKKQNFPTEMDQLVPWQQQRWPSALSIGNHAENAPSAPRASAALGLVRQMQTPAMARRFLMIVTALAALAWPAGVVAQGVSATVLSIGDGDTISVRQAGKALTVRLACIDAPETAQSPWGQQARRYLQQRLPIGRKVSLYVKTTDRYGRMVAEVIDDININLVMVEDGQAFAYRQYLSGCDAKEYLDAEFRASRRRYGVWRVEGGIARPWNFRTP
jgi:endonuclease YncB( thermonuclease family)